MSIDLHSTRASFDGIGTRLLERPHAGPTTLLFLHGWGDSADAFKPLMQELADLPARLVAIDLPHFGEADDLPESLMGRPMIPRYLRFVRAALSALGEGGNLLPVGQSFGARMLLGALDAEPALPVRNAVAIAPVPSTLSPWQQMLLRKGWITAVSEPRGLLDNVRRTCFSVSERVPQSVWDDFLRHCTPARMNDYLERMRAITMEIREPVPMRGIGCCVDLIWGDRDRMTPVDAASHFTRGLRDSRLTVFANCGHHAHLERVVETAALIRSLLSPLR